MTEQGPWTRYAQPEQGPWTRYARPEPEPSLPLRPADAESAAMDPQWAEQVLSSVPEAQRDLARQQIADVFVRNERAGGGVAQRIDDAVRRIASSVPGVGSWLDEANAAIGALGGQDYESRLAYERAKDRAIEAAPTARIGSLPLVGDVYASGLEKAAGTIGGALALPMIKTGEGVGAMAAGGAGTAAGYSALEAAGAAEQDRLSAAAGAIPRAALLGGGVGAAAGAVPKVIDAFKAVSPTEAGMQRIADALAKDVKLGTEPMTVDAFNAALGRGQPVLNVDIGGDVLRRVARGAVDTSEDAAKLIAATRGRVVEGAPAARLDEAIQRASGKEGNAARTLEELDYAARRARAPAYRKAYAAGAKGIQIPDRLIDAPAMAAAMRQASTKMKNRQAVGETTGTFGADTLEAIAALRKAGATQEEIDKAVKYAPRTLEFWDQAKQALDDKIGAAQRAGKKSQARDMTMLKDDLLDLLDKNVKQYKKARGIAAEFFGVESAVEAGQKFASGAGRYQNAAVSKAFGKMLAKEKEAFREGYISKKREIMAEAPENQNLAAKLMNSRAERQRWEIIFGKDWLEKGGLKEFVNVERRMKESYNALEGGSKTARYMKAMQQIAPYPVAGGLGYYSSGDWKGAAAGLLAAKGRSLRSEAIANRIADILASNNPALMARALPQNRLVNPLAQLMAQRSPQAAAIIGTQ